MKRSIVPIIFFFSALLTSCNYKELKSAPNESDIPITVSELKDPDFEIVMTKVIGPKCLECHSSAGGQRGGVNLETYRSVMRSLPQVKADILDGSMPKQRRALSAEQKELILTWIEKGAPEKRGQLPPVATNPDETLKMNYETVNRVVLEPACVTCHSHADPRGKVDLEGYAAVVSFKDRVKKAIIDGSMPKKGELSAKQKSLILGWIVAGAPERSDAVLPNESENDPINLPPSAKDDPDLGDISEKAFVARGKYLFNLSSCTNCHTSDPAKPLAGGDAIETPFGKFFPPNISADKNTGIGSWTARQFLRSLRQGISRDDQFYFPSFPYTNYSKMTDEDILSIRAYILTLPSTEQKNRPHELRFPYNKRSLLRVWRWLNFPEVAIQDSSNFLTARGPFQEIPEQNLSWNRGAYLVEGPLHCTQCHTPRDDLGGLKKKMWFAGSSIAGGDTPAPNITPEPTTGLGSWKKEDWQKFLSTGSKPNGERVSGEMWKVVKNGTAHLSSMDKQAVIDYLMAVPPVRNQVGRTH